MKRTLHSELPLHDKEPTVACYLPCGQWVSLRLTSLRSVAKEGKTLLADELANNGLGVVESLRSALH